MELTANQKLDLLKKALESPDGMKKLGAAMVEPILLKLPAEGLARSILMEDPLAQGQVPVYDRDITCPAVSLTQHGRVPLTEIAAERQFIDMFRIAAYPSLDKIDLKMLRYNALDTAKDRAKDGIILEEDSRIFTLLDAGIAAWEADTVNHTVSTDHTLSDSALNQDTVHEAISIVASHYLQAKHIFVNPIEYLDILSWGVTKLGYNMMDEIVKTGIIGQYAGCAVHVSPQVPIGKAYIIPENKYIGYMPLLQEIIADPLDKVEEFRVGWVIWEYLGMFIMNTRGLVRIDITRV